MSDRDTIRADPECPETSDNQQALFDLYRPLLQRLESSCEQVQQSQIDLRNQLDAFLAALREVKFKGEDDQLTHAMEEQSKKLLTLKRKLTLIHTIVQNAEERTIRMRSLYGPKSATTS
jgi:peptidoglycan hydrolase CwlO-like protein